MIHQAGLLYCFTMLRRRVSRGVGSLEGGGASCAATPPFFAHTTPVGIPDSCLPSLLFKLAVDDMDFDGRVLSTLQTCAGERHVVAHVGQ